MAVTFVNAGAFASGTGNITPALPAGCVADDILLLYVETANQPVAAPAGWTSVVAASGFGTAGGTTATILQGFWKRHSGTESDPTIVDTGDHQLAVILAYRGVVNSGNPWDATPVATSSSTANTGVTFPAVTTVTAGCLIVGAVANVSAANDPTGSYSNANLSGITERADGDAVSIGNGGNLAVFDGTKATAGSTGTTSATVPGGAGKSYITIPLKPAAVSVVTISHPVVGPSPALIGAWSR